MRKKRHNFILFFHPIPPDDEWNSWKEKSSKNDAVWIEVNFLDLKQSEKTVTFCLILNEE